MGQLHLSPMAFCPFLFQVAPPGAKTLADAGRVSGTLPLANRVVHIRRAGMSEVPGHAALKALWDMSIDVPFTAAGPWA
jgi:hypothetical protein